MKNPNNDEWNYALFLNVFEGSEDKLIVMIPEYKIANIELCSATINRFMFIEKLKDCLAQNSVAKAPMSLACISISNYEKLIKASSSIVVHDFLKNFIEKLCRYKSPHQDLTQWGSNFFIFLIEKESFENVKTTIRFNAPTVNI